MYNNVYEAPIHRPSSYYPPQMPCYPVLWPPNQPYDPPIAPTHGYYPLPSSQTVYPEMVGYNDHGGYNDMQIYPEMAQKPRLRPNSVGRKPQRRSVGALQDLQRYFQPPLQRTLPSTPEYPTNFYNNHPLGTMPRNKRPKPTISAEISATLPNSARRKSVVLQVDDGKSNIFQWFKEKMSKNEEKPPKRVYTSGSLPRNFALRTNSPKTKSMPRMKTTDVRPSLGQGMGNVFYAQIDPKSTTRKSTNLSPERGRRPQNMSPGRPRGPMEHSRTFHNPATSPERSRHSTHLTLSPERPRRSLNKTLSPERLRRQHLSPERSRTLPGPENSFYDNHNPMMYGYYNGNELSSNCTVQSNSNNGTLSKKRITRYNIDGKPIPPTSMETSEPPLQATFNDLAKEARFGQVSGNSIVDPLSQKSYPRRSSNGHTEFVGPPEPPPDYSDQSEEPSSPRRSPSPFSVPPRVRFRFPSADDIHSVKREDKVVEKMDTVQQPKGLFARTFDLKIYKKLRPLIQIRGLKIDEKELAKNEAKKRQNSIKIPSNPASTPSTASTIPSSNQNKSQPPNLATDSAKKRSIERFTAAMKETLKNSETDQPKLVDTIHKPASILYSQGSKKRRAPDPPMMPEASYSEPVKPAKLDTRTDVVDAEMALKMAENAYMNHFEGSEAVDGAIGTLEREGLTNQHIIHDDFGQNLRKNDENNQNSTRNGPNGTNKTMTDSSRAQDYQIDSKSTDYLNFDQNLNSGRKLEKSQSLGRKSKTSNVQPVVHDISSLRARFEADCSNISRVEANSSQMDINYNNMPKVDVQDKIRLKPVLTNVDEGIQVDSNPSPGFSGSVWRYNPSTDGLVQYEDRMDPKASVISLQIDENVENITSTDVVSKNLVDSTRSNGYDDLNPTNPPSSRSNCALPTRLAPQIPANPLIADSGVCYVGGTRIEYLLDRSTGPLIVHYQTKRTVHMGNLVCGGPEGTLGGEDGQNGEVYGQWTNNLPAKGVITDLDYGPGIVQKLRERFARLASTPRQEQDPMDNCTVQKRRFASAEPPTIATQILPKMDTSKLSDCMNSASSTGYSSEESNPSDASDRPDPKEPPTTLPLPNERSRRSVSVSNVEDEIQRPEIHDPTHVITPIRSLREKFERQAQNPSMNKSVRTVYSPRASSCHASVVARYPPRQQSSGRKNSESSILTMDSGISNGTSAKTVPKQPLRRLSKPQIPSFATEFTLNGKENEETEKSTGRKPILPKRTVLAKLEPEQKIVASPPSPHSSNASTSSADCPSTKSNEQELKNKMVLCDGSGDAGLAPQSAPSLTEDLLKLSGSDAFEASDLVESQLRLRNPDLIPDFDEISNLPITPIRPTNGPSLFFTPVQQPKRRRSFLGRFFTRIFTCTQPQKEKIGGVEEPDPTKKHRNSLVLKSVQSKRKGVKTSDDLDSIVSQDEFTIPPSHNATYFRAGTSPRPSNSNTERSRFLESDEPEQPRRDPQPMTSSKPSVQSVHPIFKDSMASSVPSSAERPNQDSNPKKLTNHFMHSDLMDRNPVQSPMPGQERPSSLALPHKASNGSGRSKGSPGTTPLPKMPQCKVDALKDASGMLEVHRMLSKFNAKRFNESKEKEPSTGNEADSSPNGVTESPKIYTTSESSDASFHTANASLESHNNLTKSTNSYASTSSSPKQSTPRKSLTSRYLEAKEKKDTSFDTCSNTSITPEPVSVKSVLAPLPEVPDSSFFNHTLSFYNKDDSGSTTSEDSLDMAPEAQEELLRAPIRQSLLHLVAEEDVPEILEAMAEVLSFQVIHDSRMAATTSSCIQKQSRSKSQPRRICFTDAPPQVFAYPDENCAMQLGEWKEGRPITYDEYQNIVQSANEETQHQMNQLARWRQQMQVKYAEQERALEDAVHQLNQAAINSVASTPSRTPTPTSAI